MMPAPTEQDMLRMSHMAEHIRCEVADIVQKIGTESLKSTKLNNNFWMRVG